MTRSYKTWSLVRRRHVNGRQFQITLTIAPQFALGGSFIVDTMPVDRRERQLSLFIGPACLAFWGVAA